MIPVALCLSWLLLSVHPGPAPEAPPSLEPLPAPCPAPFQKKRRGKDKVKLPPVPVAHLGSLDAARLESKERNAVLLVLAIQENEEANERFRDNVLRDAKFVRATLDCVVVIVNDGTHGQKTISEEVDGEKVRRKVCEYYEVPTCADHKRSWDRVYQEFNEDGEMTSPQMIIVLPGGKVKGRQKDQHDVGRLLASIEGAQNTAGPSLSAEQLRDVKQLLGIGRTHMKSGAWVQAWRAWTGVLAVTTKGAFAKEATEGEADALAQMREDMDAAYAGIEEGEVIWGWTRLGELSKSYVETPLEAELRKLLKKVEKNKEWKQIISDHVKELEAEALWQEIEELLSKDQEEKAVRVAKRVLRRYGETEAATKVRREFPGLEDELSP